MGLRSLIDGPLARAVGRTVVARAPRAQRSLVVARARLTGTEVPPLPAASPVDPPVAVRPTVPTLEPSVSAPVVDPTVLPVEYDRRTFADPELQRQLEAYGFAVVPMLDGDALDAVRDVGRRLGAAPDDPRRALNWTFHSRDPEHKARVKAELLGLVQPVLDRTFVDHRVYLSTFITKWPGPDSGFAPHQDPSLVDERFHRGVTVWIPLDDTPPSPDVDNGMLHLMPGSHRLSRTLRFSDVDRSAFAPHDAAIVDHLSVAVPLRAGEALVFDNRVVHFSMPNRSDRPRVVASFGMRPAEGHCILLRDDGAGAVDLFHVDDDFYIDVLPATQHEWVPPTPPVAKVALVREGWSPDELLAARHAAGDPPRGIVSDPGSLVWSDPGRFCALCGSDDVDVDDRGARNNAQLVCRSCAAGLAG